VLRDVEIVVDNRLRVATKYLTQQTLDELRRAFTYENPEWKKLRAFGFKKRVKRTLRTWEFEKDWLTLPRGGLQRVRDILRGAGHKWWVDDRRSEGSANRTAQSYNGRAVPEHQLELWDFQERLVKAAIERENCLWRSPQASGKTSASIAFASRVNLPSLFVVSTTNLLDQWLKRCRKELGIEPGVIQGKRREIRSVSVGMQQTLRDCAGELQGKFGLVVCDEVQEFAASTFQEVIDVLDCRYRLGVSADEQRADGKEFLIYDQFGGVAAEVSHEELVERGFIHEVEVRVVLSDFRADWYRKLKTAKQKVASYDRLMEEMAHDEERQQRVLWCVEQGLADEEQVIVLSNRREHCHAIDAAVVGTGVSSGFLIGGADYRRQFELTLQRLETGEARVAVGTYQAIGVGFDFPRIARGVLATPVANNAKGDKQFRQFRGRFARTTEGKQGAVLYFIHDPHVFGTRPVRHLCRWSKIVRVRQGDGWVDGRQYVKETDNREKKKRDEEGGDEPTLEQLLGR
jgi:superfamily II DNA or RNA helicase